MKVIVSCVPQTGHITPLLPLAEALTANGDEVIIASGPDVEDVASSRGLPFRPVGPALDSWFSALGARTRGIPGDGLSHLAGIRHRRPARGGALLRHHGDGLSSFTRPGWSGKPRVPSPAAHAPA